MQEMTQRELYAIRAQRYAEGRCPMCNETADFKRTRTAVEAGHKFRTLHCHHCGSTFRVEVKTEIRFCKVTRAGDGMTL